MIDFTNAKRRNKTYAGANGNKISIIYENELYMLKFPSYAKHNPDMSYSNSCFSEYLGCKIFESIGIPTQKVLLGKYVTEKRIEKIVVACKDFATNGLVVQDFASLKNQIVDSDSNGYGTELQSIKETFESQSFFEPNILKQRFWDMFIVDALIGNWDRHNGNWGFLYDPLTDKNILAPVFDCGSSLYPQADDKIMKSVFSNEQELKTRIFDTPTSAIKIDKTRINYYQFISSLKDKDCNEALKRIAPKINKEKIFYIIDETPLLSELQKAFYKKMIDERNTIIIQNSLKRLKKREQEILHKNVIVRTKPKSAEELFAHIHETYPENAKQRDSGQKAKSIYDSGPGE